MLRGRLNEWKTRSPGWVLSRFELRCEVLSYVQEFVHALADATRIASDGVELNNQNVFQRKSVQIWREVAREAAEISKKLVFHHCFECLRQRCHYGVSIVPVPGVNHVAGRPRAEKQCDVRAIGRDPRFRVLRIEVGGTKFSTSDNRSDDRRKLVVIPGRPAFKAMQLLAGHSPQDRISEIVHLLIRGEADLRMGFKLSRQPGGPAFGGANADKVDLGSSGHYWRRNLENLLGGLRRVHSRTSDSCRLQVLIWIYSRAIASGFER